MKYFLLVMAVLLLSARPLRAHDHAHHAGGVSEMDRNRPEALHGTSLYQVFAQGSSNWRDASGEKFAFSTLKGKPVVMAMFYASCKTACPLLIRDMQKIEKALPEKLRKETRFALFSFDPDRDTPEKLKELAREHGLDLSRWVLAQGDASSVRELAAVLGVRYKKDASGDFSHSNLITVLDREGVIRKQQAGLGADPAETVEALKSI